LDLILDLNYFSFSNPDPTHFPKHQTLIISFLSVFDVQNSSLLCACAHGVKSENSQVRNFAWHRTVFFGGNLGAKKGAGWGN